MGVTLRALLSCTEEGCRKQVLGVWVGVCMRACGCVGGGDMVYGCRCESGQDENSDYTCAEYIDY